MRVYLKLNDQLIELELPKHIHVGIIEHNSELNINIRGNCKFKVALCGGGNWTLTAIPAHEGIESINMTGTFKDVVSRMQTTIGNSEYKW